MHGQDFKGRKEGHFNKFGIMIYARDGDREKSLFKRARIPKQGKKLE